MFVKSSNKTKRFQEFPQAAKAKKKKKCENMKKKKTMNHQGFWCLFGPKSCQNNTRKLSKKIEKKNNKKTELFCAHYLPPTTTVALTL